MSSIEQMKEQLACYQKDLEAMENLAKHYFEIADLENAIWTLQQRIREAEMLELHNKSGEIRAIDPKLWNKICHDPALLDTKEPERMTTYSPTVRITLEHGGASIRLSDVLENSVRVYSKDFEPIEAGSICELVIKVDDRETREQVQLLENLTKETHEFTFIRSKAMSETKLISNANVEFYKVPEPTIKVSELREWCELQIKVLSKEYVSVDGVREINAYKDILNKFCGGKDESK